MTSLLQVLVLASVWGAIAVLLIALARPLLKRLGGAAMVYRSWWLLPLALLAPVLPVPALAVIEAAPVRAFGEALNAPLLPAEAPLWPALLVAVWLAGALGMAVLQIRAQRRFERAMGSLSPRPDGSWQASADPGLPALVGVLAPRIVVGPDFDHRFSAAERDLVLQHERSHRAHGDHWANLAVAGLRCVFWFHPLVPWATRRFLCDQELACDARTVDPHPALRRLYASTLLKAQLVHPVAPMACHWRSQPMLKERIAMLKQNKRKALPWVAGQVLVVGLCVGLCTMAWASQAGDAGTVDAQVIDTTAPKYPVAAFEQGVSGKVDLRVEVGADGRVTDVRVLSATPAGVFDDAAVTSARAWTFKPALRGGKPVASALKIPVTFEMNDEAPAP
ncbi:TonB family protein [Stenotrophomonas sp.]|uniref:TonB family protein n=1 Tax=Stenotrophomonas sp. TaxID=69392 RepID=UPI0028A096D5|nr:TonB family protein [Stenotrophomonas sp.]